MGFYPIPKQANNQAIHEQRINKCDKNGMRGSSLQLGFTQYNKWQCNLYRQGGLEEAKNKTEKTRQQRLWAGSTSSQASGLVERSASLFSETFSTYCTILLAPYGSLFAPIACSNCCVYYIAFVIKATRSNPFKALPVLVQCTLSGTWFNRDKI